MAIKIQPYTSALEGAVREFNGRLELGSWEQRFPESAKPTILPRGTHPALYNEMFLAVDDSGAVRGGYILKHQEFRVAGKIRSVANYAFPLSEGVIDRRFGLVGIAMILDAQKRNPLLFGLGMGGLSHPSVRVMKGVGWSAEMVPFFFRILSPFAFLRNMTHLRRSGTRRLAMDGLAFSGLGWVAIRLMSLRRRRPQAGVKVELVERFGDWADEVWGSVDSDRGLQAVRDKSVLNLLYPAGSRYLILKVSLNNLVIGWAVCIDTQMSDSSYFGNLRVGTIVDGLAVPGRVKIVAEAADDLMQKRHVDLIVTNQTYREWCSSLDALGYRQGPSNFALTCSKRLVDELGPLEEVMQESLVNRGDGDGPINL